MNKALLLLLPFRHIFRQLKLENRWWHRLSLVLFFAALLFAFVVAAGLSYLTFAPQVSATPDISIAPDIGAPSDWVDVPQGTTAIPPPPDGSAIVKPEQSRTVPIPAGAQIDNSQAIPGRKSIQMPDGSTTTFPFSMADDAIKAHWVRAKQRQLLHAILFTGLIAIVSTLVLSYALQLAYRALLYVIFGGKLSTESEPAAT